MKQSPKNIYYDFTEIGREPSKAQPKPWADMLCLNRSPVHGTLKTGVFPPHPRTEPNRADQSLDVNEASNEVVEAIDREQDGVARLRVTPPIVDRWGSRHGRQLRRPGEAALRVSPLRDRAG